MKRFAVVLMGALLLVGVDAFTPAGTAAQIRERPGSENRERLERQIRERFENLIQTELGIDEAVSAELRSTMESFTEERRALGQRQAEFRRRLRSSGSLLDVDAAQEVLDELVAVQRAEGDLLAREQAALLQVLTPPQLVRFYTLREQFTERVRALRGGGPPGRRGGGGNGSTPLPIGWPYPL
ncbi:MAG: hypothetical protein KJO11_14935 [Gemmatimonadetes bacterium]|nr:hypothetical protein [Gemmatimonadota bacterium]MBT8402342.1 hypothetical protein [Gemmatimonadota bacterium]NNK61750.1 hypothetical protein [Gemmatimonadota bacterium]